MKKHKISVFLLGLLVLCSVGAFVYLNSVAPLPEYHENQQGIRTTRVEVEEVEKPILPDVKFIQKAVETGKRFIPAF